MNPPLASKSKSEFSSGKPKKEILQYNEEGTFVHDTGDTYEGWFEIKKKDRSLRMQGLGTYTTHDGDVYTGFWDHDKFGFGNQTVHISYKSGAVYQGFINNLKYQGKGKYTYPDGSVLEGEFNENVPVGELILTDPNGHKWCGKADVGFVDLKSFNPYYHNLDSTIDKAEIRRRFKEFHPPSPEPCVKKVPTPPPESRPESPKSGPEKKVNIVAPKR